MQFGIMQEEEDATRAPSTWQSLRVGRGFWSEMIWAVDVESSHFSERSKSVSMMWPSDLIKTFSGLRSR